VTAEGVDLVLHRVLEAFHDQERHNGSGESNGNADNGNLMNRRREALRLLMPDSFRYEIREVQLIANFCKIEQPWPTSNFPDFQFYLKKI
jgi:hypothetical protein